MSAERGHSRATSASAGFVLALLAAMVSGAGAQGAGSIAGVVRTASAPVANARAILDSEREQRTDSAGRFAFHDVAAGRHTLNVLSIGIAPHKVDVIVTARDTITFELLVEKIVTLDSVRVEGSTVRQAFVRDYEDRKRVGLGRFLDSIEVRKFAYLQQAVALLPGVRRYKNTDTLYFAGPGGSLCLPHIWIDRDNWGTDQGRLNTIRPDDVMAVEVYTRNMGIPDEFTPRGLDKGCGALIVWTRRLWPGKVR